MSAGDEECEEIGCLDLGTVASLAPPERLRRMISGGTPEELKTQAPSVGMNKKGPSRSEPPRVIHKSSAAKAPSFKEVPDPPAADGPSRPVTPGRSASEPVMTTLSADRKRVREPPASPSEATRTPSEEDPWPFAVECPSCQHLCIATSAASFLDNYLHPAPKRGRMTLEPDSTFTCDCMESAYGCRCGFQAPLSDLPGLQSLVAMLVAQAYAEFEAQPVEELEDPPEDSDSEEEEVLEDKFGDESGDVLDKDEETQLRMALERSMVDF